MSRRAWGILVAALGVLLAASAGADSAAFDAAKAKYLSLRNTDVELVRVEEWRAVAREFEAFARAEPGEPTAPRALLNAAIVHRELFRRLRQQGEIDAAIRSLTAIEGEYRRDPLADDAALLRADILRDELGDSEAARSVYAELLKDFPSADMAGVARERLKRLDGDVPAESGGRTDKTGSSGADAGPVVVLDPGHGGEDFGAEGPGGLLEKDVTLAVAREVERLLKTELGVRVRLTRTGDAFLPLLERTAFANNLDAAVFLSIHVNASPGKNVSGIESYYLDTSDGESSRTLAERENSSVRFEGAAGDLAYMLSDLVQSAKTGDSIRLAELVQRALTARLSAGWSDVKNLGVKKALFYVLVGAHMPCALVELGFMDHPIEGKRIADEAYRREIARGIFEGLKMYLQSSKPHAGL